VELGDIDKVVQRLIELLEHTYSEVRTAGADALSKLAGQRKTAPIPQQGLADCH